MSGDVQPRKRKDKKKKKEGGSLGSIHEPINIHKFKRSESDDQKVFDLPDQGEKIHVQNEHGIGGNICVKIIFFCLFGLLIGAVGLIYLKSQGSTDVDLPTIEESRFAEYFTGWLDDNTDDHEHEAPESNVDDDHDDHDDHEAHEEHENDEDHSTEHDPIYKLFGLHDDEADEIEESNIVANKVPESEISGIRPDVNEDEVRSEDEEAKKYKEDDNDSGIGLEEKNNDNDDDDEDEDENEDEDEDEDEDADADANGLDSDNKNDEDEDEDENEDEDEDEGEDADANAVGGENKNDEDEDDEKNDEDEDKNDEGDVNESDDDDEDLSQVDDEEEESKDDDKTQDKALSVEKPLDNNDDENDDDNNSNGNDNKEEESKESGDLEEEEQEEASKEMEDVNSKVDNDDLGFGEIDISEEDFEEEILSKLNAKNDKEKPIQSEKEVGKSSAEDDIELNITEKEEEEENAGSGGVALKLIVGIALIIVAHLVLVKKWRSMNNAPSDENAPIKTETASEKKEVEKLHSLDEPIISRRQTLVPENVRIGDENDEEELEDEEEEEEEEELVDNDELYSEEECEEDNIKESKKEMWESFEKPSWNIKKNESESEGDQEYGEEEEEEEYEEDIEEEQEEDNENEEEEEEDEDDEEDVDAHVEDDIEFVKENVNNNADEEKPEEVEESAPIPPPRTRSGRGAQDVDEDSLDHLEEYNNVEGASQDGPKAGDETNNSGPEEQNAPERKVGNEDEWAYRQELDFADEQFENNPKAAVEIFEKIISSKPTMIRALIGRARALDHWAEKEKSNTYLKQAINAYKTLLLEHGHLLDDDTYVKLAERCIERMRFAGALVSAIDVHKALILKYPNTPKYRNTLAVTYLMLNKIPQARTLLNETLTLWPEDGFALVHYGFILKTSDNNMEEGAKKLMAGIQTKQEGVIDGMFFFHLGDALNRLGRGKEAMEWYELGVKEGLFLSKYQRSLYNVNRLKGQPWWTKEETTYQDFFKKLENNWREIRREGLDLLNSKGVNLFKEEAENLKDTGDWKQLDLYFRGRKQANCNKAPVTCSLVSSFKPASTCTRGQIKFSVMLPNTHVWPHCGPTNCRLRSHLGLVVPKKTFIRVAEETRSWEEGKFIIFDDSFEHEVWHNGTGPRLVLIVDVWHPELTNHERRYLSPI